MRYGYEQQTRRLTEGMETVLKNGEAPRQYVRNLLIQHLLSSDEGRDLAERMIALIGE